MRSWARVVSAVVAVLALVAGLAPVSVWEAMADDPPDDGGTRTVRFYWSEEVCTQALAEAWGLADCEEFDQEDLWGHPAWIADGGLRVFDADGQPVTGVDHGYAADSAVTLDQVNSRARGRAFELVPGWYGWEGWGHQGRRVGGGVFEVPAGEGPLELFISQAQIVLSPSSPASKIELWDYLGNPVEPALTWDGYMPSATYAVLARQAGEFYDAVDNPTDVGQAYSYRVTPVDQTAASAKSGLLYWPEIAWPAVDAPNNAFRNAFRDTYDWTRSQVRFVDGKWYRSTGGEGYAYLSLAVPHRFEVAVTAGARFRVFEKGPRHFEAFTEHLPVSGPVRDEDGLYDRYVFMLPDSVHVHYEAGGGEWLREAQSFQVRPDVSVYRVTVDLEALDNHPAEPFDPGTQGTPSAGQLESGLLLNLDDSQHLSLDVGGSFDLFPIRVWQAMEGTTGNYFVEPDYHLELVDFAGETDRLDSFDGGSAEVSAVSLTPVGAPGRQEYRVTGLSEGTALIRITYDAVAWRPSHATPDPDLSSQPGGQRTYLGPTEPRSAGLVVVTVGAADSSGISLGLAESGERGGGGEDDTVYFRDTEGSTGFSFTVSSTAAGDLRVRSLDPSPACGLGDECWTDYGSIPNGSTATVNLKDGKNLVQVTDLAGAVRYHVVNARAIPVTVVNQTNSDWVEGDPVSVGDRLSVRLDGLVSPVPKLAGVYNPGYPAPGEPGSTVYVEYTLEDAAGESRPPLESNRVSYEISAGVTLSFEIQSEGETRLGNGRIHSTQYGDSWGSHRNLPQTGRPPNLSAAHRTDTPWHSLLPDLVFSTESVDVPVVLPVAPVGDVGVVVSVPGVLEPRWVHVPAGSTLLDAMAVVLAEEFPAGDPRGTWYIDVTGNGFINAVGVDPTGAMSGVDQWTGEAEGWGQFWVNGFYSDRGVKLWKVSNGEVVQWNDRLASTNSNHVPGTQLVQGDVELAWAVGLLRAAGVSDDTLASQGLSGPDATVTTLAQLEALYPDLDLSWSLDPALSDPLDQVKALVDAIGSDPAAAAGAVSAARSGYSGLSRAISWSPGYLQWLFEKVEPYQSAYEVLLDAEAAVAQSTPSPTPTPTPTPSETPTVPPSASPSPTPTPTPTVTPDPTPTLDPSVSPTPTLDPTPTPSPSPTPTSDPSETPSVPPSESPSPTPDPTPTPTPTTDPTPSPSVTPTLDPSQTPDPTPSESPSVPPSVGRAELADLVALAEALPLSGSYVTPASTAVDDALVTARSVLADPGVGDGAVTGAYRSLADAVAALKADSLEHGFVDGTVFVQGSTVGLTHVTVRDLSLHSGVVSVDGVSLTVGTDYLVSAGSTTVRLESGYLAGLQPGQHTLSVGFTSGWSAVAGFRTVLAGGLPDTGGPAGLERWLVVWLLAAGAVSSLAWSRRLLTGYHRSQAHAA